MGPKEAAARRVKVCEWAQEYPDYWRGYRRSHPDYVGRDNLRRRKSRGKAKRAAKQTAIREISVEKLRKILSDAPLSAAKQTPIARRVEGVVDFLIWKECAAKQRVIDPDAGPGR